MLYPVEKAIEDIAENIAEKNRRIQDLETEVERLQAELDAERHEEKCFETSFLNVCLYAEIDTGQSREVMEEELVGLVKAAKAAGGD